MTLLVDTSAWSLVLCRDQSRSLPEIDALKSALEVGEMVVTTGLVLQELLQGFSGPRDRAKIVDRFSALPLLTPDRQDHMEAADLRNRCRRAGVQVGTIDALLARLCIHYSLMLLTTDRDFVHIAARSPLRLWKAGG